MTHCDSLDCPLVAHSDVCWEQEERLLQLRVTREVEQCLTQAKASVLHCQVLLLPRLMSTRLGLDVVRCSTDEPCGLRGATIRLYVERRKEGLKPVGSISPDPSVTPTFELSVVFRADEADGWPHLLSLFDGGKVLKLRPEYRLVKRKLYSSASPVVVQSDSR